ncbi:precorrin-2 dehydrogenase/sirohydrochlorin ferrochelatase family protein [Sulfoacidibacillus thermotolerans]|uniref:precorrin-2 dehydrogenase n=1 Tax=Sulfoacidibacillus thermotolerans TaxID=1765684 RepID=A0A2U3DBT5_SULT2|nr:bifunctional precorrin-2 dehydrogenase/sirohydrochlorin ferrochelatase [Sulfoacidibacillus thermotolerans]PWI58725.1 hypothetical protein BM613_01110 [Sulfoacidibacillus thermotolerans]
MSFYSAFLDLQGEPCLVVGGGIVALRKVRTLIEAGAKITVVSPSLHTELADLRDSQALLHVARTYHVKDLAAKRLVFAATNDASVNAQVARDAKQHGIFVNVSDDPTLCTFLVPAVIRRGEIQVAIGSSGQSPALTRALREYIEEYLPQELGELASYLANIRKEILSLDRSTKMKHESLKNLITADLLRLWQSGHGAAFQDTVTRVCMEYGLSVDPLPQHKRSEIENIDRKIGDETL